jgi:hypothetical protein
MLVAFKILKTSSQNYASAERSYKIMTEETFASLDKEKPRVTM